MTSSGIESFTVTRAIGQTTGVYKNTFSAALTSSEYVITVTQQLSGYSKVWDSTTPTTTEFHVVTYTTTNTPVKCICYFSVVAGICIFIK